MSPQLLTAIRVEMLGWAWRQKSEILARFAANFASSSDGQRAGRARPALGPTPRKAGRKGTQRPGDYEPKRGHALHDDSRDRESNR
jgi:hypothetical protein